MIYYIQLKKQGKKETTELVGVETPEGKAYRRKYLWAFFAKHADWADIFCKKYDGITEENVMDILKKEVGEVFVHVL